MKAHFRPDCSTTVQFSSVAQLCPTLCDPMNRSTPGLPVHRQLLEFTQTHVHWVGDAIHTSHPLSSPSPPAPSTSQHQGLFQWVNSSHEVAKVLEFQPQHHSFQWTPRTGHPHIQVFTKNKYTTTPPLPHPLAGIDQTGLFCKFSDCFPCSIWSWQERFTGSRQDDNPE